ncbi:MAG TPA: biopolymer transporter ExbD [Bacteroidales bacterium]|jgi:biopolymer transport protein ExbD|nr:biopolymer transporter ExbD [Bacteroidales bacterium]
MAEIMQVEKGGKKRAKKILPHMDMTPMVDLMMLLITFFMLTTSLSKSKVMEMILPEKLRDPNAEPPKIVASRTLNILLGPDNKIYWYAGGVSPDEYDNLPPVYETDYSDQGVRALLLERNRALFRKINDFEQQVLEGKIRIPRDSVQSAISQLKTDDDTGPIVLLKAYKKANYGNFVDILDEMNICGIARYTIMDIAWYEEQMVERAAGITSTTASAN